MSRPTLVFTIGDINGIGPEVLLASLRQPHVRAHCDAIIIANSRLLADTIAALPASWAAADDVRGDAIAVTDDGVRFTGADGTAVTVPIVEIASDARLMLGGLDHGDPDHGSEPGSGGREALAPAGRLAGDAITRAVALVLEGRADGIVTMPIAKEALHLGGYDFPGHTEMLAALAGGSPLMILTAGGMRVALVTIHIPLVRVAGELSEALIVERGRAFHDALRVDFSLPQPRIAVLALNPHAGEHGHIGTEEGTIIAPAVARLRAEGIDARGPFPADAFFARYDAAAQDGILTMYHDQGLIPLKFSARGHGVNITAGLPIVRTSPDHGTAMDIAGRGIAEPASVIEAIVTAAAIVRARNEL